MAKQNRILSIDIMRGLTLFLMLFVNDLYVKGVPAWLGHRPANFDGMGLADWVFPGFLFMVGMAVPFAIQSRRKKGDNTIQIVGHILIRTLSLLLIGVLMLNVDRMNPELTGMPKYLWAILIYVCIFLVWNMYQIKASIAFILKVIGVLGMLALLLVFKAGTSEQVTWIRTGWWGILGLIGWGYLVTSLVYLFIKENIWGAAMVWLFFVGLNVVSQLGMLEVLKPVKPVFGVILEGNVPSIVMAGLFFSLLLRKMKTNYYKFLVVAANLGIGTTALGLLLQNWFIVSKIQGTPSWAMLCNGISILVFVVLFLVLDVFRLKKWASVFKPAGENSLTTYLAPNIIYYSIWWSGFPVLFYKQASEPAWIILGSVVWALLMIGFTAALSKVGIRLKL